MKKISIALFLIIFIGSNFTSKILAEEITTETLTIEKESKTDTEIETDEQIQYKMHKVTFIDKQRNTVKVVKVQANRVVEEIRVSDEPIKYKGGRKQRFMYWGIKKNNKYVSFNFNNVIKKDITLHAVYSVINKPIEKNYIKKKIVFNYQNGQNTFEILIDKNKMAEPKVPIKNGYVFTGWYTKSEGGEKWDFAKDSVNGDMTLYAHWIKKNTNYSVSPKTGYDVSRILSVLFMCISAMSISIYRVRKKYE